MCFKSFQRLKFTLGMILLLLFAAREVRASNCEQLKKFLIQSPPKAPLILMYHDIVNGSLRATGDVSIHQFRSQMKFLNDLGYQTISVEELSANLKDPLNHPLPKRSVLITFDDGYYGTYKNAVPILREQAMKASFFIHPSYVGVKTGSRPNFISSANIDSDELAALNQQIPAMKVAERDHPTWNEWKSVLSDSSNAGLFKIYSHGLTHKDMSAMLNVFMDDLEESRLDFELTLSQKLLEEFLNLPCNTCTAVAYPEGKILNQQLELTSLIYQIGFAISRDPPQKHDLLKYSIPRVEMGQAHQKDKDPKKAPNGFCKSALEYYGFVARKYQDLYSTPHP